MTDRERDLVDELMAISSFSIINDSAKVESIKQGFLLKYPVDVTSDYIIGLLETAYFEQNADDVELSLYIGSSFGLIAENFTDILCKLVVADWHFQHENIASTLQILKDPKTIDSLYAAALLNLKYLEYSDVAPLARKCIWALSEIGTSEAKAKLKQLAGSDCEKVSDYALRQLKQLQ